MKSGTGMGGGCKVLHPLLEEVSAVYLMIVRPHLVLLWSAEGSGRAYRLLVYFLGRSSKVAVILPTAQGTSSLLHLGLFCRSRYHREIHLFSPSRRRDRGSSSCLSGDRCGRRFGRLSSRQWGFVAEGSICRPPF